MKMTILLPATFLVALTSLSFAAEIEAIPLQAERQYIEPRKDYSAKVEIPTLPEEMEAVVEFSAWYESPRPMGYFGVLRVYWNGEELKKVLDRPASFVIKDGREQPIYGVSGWMTAAVPEPGMVYSDSSKYSVVTDFENFTRYRFLLPASQGGHALKIANRRGAQDGIRLVLEDIRITFVHKDQLGPVLEASQ